MYITIIEDEKVLSNNISKKLLKNWFNTKIINSYNDFINQSSIESDLYVIDISLRDWNGFDIIKYLREDKDINSPIIITSWYTDAERKIYGLDLWADDYLAKPFTAEELIARIRALLRRSYKVSWNSKASYNGFIYDIKNKKIKKDWIEIDLTPAELKLAEFLLFNIWKLISKEQLINSVWWEYDLTKITDNNINVTVSKLRKKLWDDFKLKTLVNKGYILQK